MAQDRHTIGLELKWLEAQECRPMISCLGPKAWRAHVNCYGKFWADAETPYKAIKKASLKWQQAGCPNENKTSKKEKEHVI
jgi:hypothetical protein